VCWTLLLGIGLPAALIRFAGSPLPHHSPSREELLRWLDQPLTRDSLTIALTYLLWLIWALFIAVVLAEALAHLTRIRLPRPRLPYPLHSVVGGLFGAAAVTVSTAPMPAHATAADQAAAPDQSVPSATAHPHRDRTGTVPSRPQWTGAAVGSHQPVWQPFTDPTLVTRRVHETAVAGVTAPSGTGAPSMVLLAGYRQPKTNTDTGRYVVLRGDTLSSIARRHLGDANRWPEICRLNWHRHWPKVGGTLRDCDLIYPGWDLKLPADAKPPTGAAPAPPPPPPAQPEPDPEPGESGQPTPTPSVSTPAQDPDGVVELPTTTAPASSASAPGVAPPPTTAPTPGSPTRSASAPATTSPDSGPTASDDKTTSAPSADDSGVRLPGGSFVPWALAAAITAAAAMVWLQRRRRFVPGGDSEDDDPPELPPPVVKLHRYVARNPEVSMPSDLAERAAAVPALPLLPPGGAGLVGDGAHAAARAALVSTLASGGPRDPDRRGEVVIDGTTLTTLIGADAAALGPWPRLHVADDLDHALSILDARLLHRARILDEHSLTDLDRLRERAPDEEALPPVLLICETPPPGARMRARVSFGLGTGLDVSALLLGAWKHGTTVDVAADGYTRVVDGPPVEAIGDRVAVLDTAEAVAILATLREAHTGERPTLVLRPPVPPRAAEPGPQASADHDGGDSEPTEQVTQEPSGTPAGEQRRKVQLRALGTPRVEDIRLPGRSLRGKAAELAVYLACHPDGADTATIAEHLFPEAKVRAAKQSVHTNASNLRHVLGRAGGPLPGGYVLKRGASARYRLDPATVEVDLWRLRDLLTRAQLASVPARTDLLREACEAYAAPLAAGCDYDWAEPHRERVRQWGTEAHLLLAEDLLATDPQAASDLLDKAIGLDRYNEQLYRKAMHARHALHDADGIRALLRAITKALSDLDAEPADATVELAAQLRASLETR
jgi:DNA-binding SARP family transcriptional activator